MVIILGRHRLFGWYFFLYEYENLVESRLVAFVCLTWNCPDVFFNLPDNVI